MILYHPMSILLIVVLTLLLQSSLDAKHVKICPLGFQLAQNKNGNNPICYRLKGPETFADVFKNCVGNLYTLTLYDKLIISYHTELVLWTEYQSAYVGGPFIDASFTETAGSVLMSSFDLNNTQQGIEDKICLARSPLGNYTTEKCDSMYYRYCFVEPYPEDQSQEECEDVEGSVKFWSPKPVCLTALKARHGSVRTTWIQSEELCKYKIEGGKMLYHGWRYTNNPKLRQSTSHTDVFPLHVRHSNALNVSVNSNSDHNNMLWYCGGWIPSFWIHQVMETHPCTYNHDAMPFIDTAALQQVDFTDSAHAGLTDVAYGALVDNVWTTVNRSYVFFDVICEKELALENVTLTVTAIDKKLILITNREINIKDEITCFTDTVTYYPQSVIVQKENLTNRYIIIPRYSGYYWCITKNPSRFLPSESNKLLWIRDKVSLKHKYAVHLVLKKSYTLDNIADFKIVWEKTFKDYIYYYTKFKNITESEFDEVEDKKHFNELLKQYKYDHPEMNYEKQNILTGDMKIKKVHLEGRQALLHVELDPRIKPVPLGVWWDDIKVVFMRPVHYCSVDGLLFENRLKHNGKIYSCIGNYNTGKIPIVISNYIEDVKYTGKESAVNRTNVTLTIPRGKVATVRNNERDKQLQQVMDNLEGIFQNTSVPIEDIRPLLDQVDKLLASDEDLEIPGRLMYLLDRIGNTLELNGTEPAQEIRNNVALVVVNADPSVPVVGLSIAVRQNDYFTNEAFEIIRNEIDCSKLLSNTSEAVVRLPGSVANSTRRVSFVVFRNDRAFRTNVTNETVLNSRVISVNIENTTQFQQGEMMNIYLRPFRTELNRDQSRSCGSWKIVNDTFGYWSQEGCEFIPASTPDGTLDTCQCTHLTHYAEILVSRMYFP